MGMDKQVIGNLQKGVDLLHGFTDVTNQGVDGATEDKARLMEVNAQQQAHATRRSARQQADAYSENAEARRASSHASWGKSNLAMSGSKALVGRAQKNQDKAREGDIRFEGDQAAKQQIAEGEASADALRNPKRTPLDQSILTLGSNIFKIGE